MALRMTEEQFAEWQRKHTPATQGQIADFHRQHSPIHCIPASRPAVSVPDGDMPLPADPPKRKSKYGNHRVQIDGIWFDSKHEADIYVELMLRVRAGEIRCVLRQVSFDLPGGIRYVADFVTIAPDLRIEGVYDAKSEATKQNRVYINKRKQMLACYGISIREV